MILKFDCPRCSKAVKFPNTLCANCESEITKKQDSNYDKKLRDGFAMMGADEDITEYNDIWS